MKRSNKMEKIIKPKIGETDIFQDTKEQSFQNLELQRGIYNQNTCVENQKTQMK